jgi:hypothetical protein
MAWALPNLSKKIRAHLIERSAFRKISETVGGIPKARSSWTICCHLHGCYVDCLEANDPIILMIGLLRIFCPLRDSNQIPAP